MAKEDKQIRVEVKLKAFIGGRRVYPGQKIYVLEKEFNPTVFKKVSDKEIPEGEVKAVKETEKAPGTAETQKVSKEVI